MNDRYLLGKQLTPLWLFVLNMVLKLLFIDSNSIGGDEPFSIFHAQLSIPAILDMLQGENNPPLHFLLLHYWINVFGIDAFSVRFPSVLCSSLTAVVLFQMGKSFWNYRTGLLVALLFTFSNYQMVFAHEARVYALFALLTAVSMFYFLKITKGHSNWKTYLFLLIANTLLLYAHYFGFWVVFIQFGSLLLLNDKRFLIRKHLIYLGVQGLCYLPMVVIFVQRLQESTTKGTWVRPPDGPDALYNMLRLFSNAPVVTVVALVIILLAVVKGIRQKAYQQLPAHTFITILWFAIPFLGMFLLSFKVPMFVDRYLIFVSLGYYLVLAIASLYLLEQSRFKYIVPAILVIMFAVSFQPDMDNKRQVKQTVEKLKELKQNDVKVLVSPVFFKYDLAYYYDLEIFKDVHGKDPYQNITERLQEEHIYFINHIREVDMKGDKVIFLDAASTFSFPDNQILKTLQDSFRLKSTYHFDEIFDIYEFEK